MSNSKSDVYVLAAHELVAELHRNPDTIPAYNSEFMKMCTDQINKLYDQNYNALCVESGSADASTVTTQDNTGMLLCRQAVIDRIKQCCCLYIEERRKRIQTLRWENGPRLPAEIQRNLAAEEVAWFRKHGDMVSAYQNSIGEGGVNLRHHMRPPRNLLEHVEVLQDEDLYQTTDGRLVSLRKGSTCYLPTVDCQDLVQRGVVVMIDSMRLS